MKISDMHPFARNVMQINLIPMQKYGKAGDTRMFYMYDSAIAYIDGEEYPVSFGSLVVIPAAVPYYFKCDAPIRMIAVNYDYTESAAHIIDPRPPRSLRNFNESLIIERLNFEDCAILNRPIVLENMWSLQSQLELMLKEFEYRKPFFREIASSMLKQMIFEIIRMLTPGQKSSVITDSVLEYIHAHYAEDIDNESVAANVGYHSYYLNRLLKAVAGTTIRQYIIDYRIEVAKRYLEQTNFSIGAVAELCGYRNLCNFSVDFKKKTGASPSAYRKSFTD